MIRKACHGRSKASSALVLGDGHICARRPAACEIPDCFPVRLLCKPVISLPLEFTSIRRNSFSRRPDDPLSLATAGFSACASTGLVVALRSRRSPDISRARLNVGCDITPESSTLLDRKGAVVVWNCVGRAEPHEVCGGTGIQPDGVRICLAKFLSYTSFRGSCFSAKFWSQFQTGTVRRLVVGYGQRKR